MTNHITFAQFCSAVRRKGALALCLAFCTLGLGSTASAEKARIITFNAPNSGTVANTGTQAAGINFFGTVTGNVTDNNFGTHGFVRTPDGKFTNFDAPGANPVIGCTCPSAINDRGVVTGYYIDTDGVSHGFLRSPEGQFTTFDVTGAGGFGSFAIAINLEGAVVGYYTDANFNFHAFLRSPNGRFTTWSGPGACENGQPDGCYGSSASNINVFGIAVGGFEDNSGNFVDHGLIRRPDGTLTTFDAPGAGTGSYQGTGCPGCARGLNQLGAIAGTYIDANSVQHGFLRSPDGTFTTFEAPGAGTSSNQGTGCPSDCPTSLNDFGAIMGTYIDTNYVLHGYLRSPNGNIATVDPVGSNFTWSSGLNDRGVVTGYYIDTDGVGHGFLRVPD
jgi:probable HAF family extracellular repeat protein